MVSPELLRRYPFFGRFNETQLRELAMIASQIELEAGQVVLAEHQPAELLFLLMEGSVELTYKSEEEYHPKTRKVFAVGEINPGEVFGVSSVIEPHVYNATASTTASSKLVKFDALALRKLMEQDASMGCAMYHQLAGVIKERLAYTRVQLAAAWA